MKSVSIVLEGKVVHGKGAGRSHNMPTANIQIERDAFPEFGVYGGQISIDGKDYLTVVNIGLRPSADNNPEPTVEALVLDFKGDLYGKDLVLKLELYIRQIMKFAGLDEVRAQISKDIETFKAFKNN